MASTQDTIQQKIKLLAWRKPDTAWTLGLYGTAIGAGTLFLPINAGAGGLWPLIAMALISFPMTFFSHRALCRFVLSGATKHGNITDVVEEHFGRTGGRLITLAYFFAIYPILLIYSVAITNTVQAFMVHQLDMVPPPRAILSLALILLLMLIVHFGEKVIVKVMSILVYPFIVALMFLAIYLIPKWNMSIIYQTASFTDSLLNGSFLKALFFGIPVIVFSFNHSPIISSFALANKREYGVQADAKCSRILLLSHIMMVVTVMFFVFSCVFSLSAADLIAADEQNISILSYMADKFSEPLIHMLAPLIAAVAISKSFLGHYLGAREGLNGLITTALREHGKTIGLRQLNRITAIFVVATAWLVATINPSILGMIETIGGPIIAFLLFLMPMYAIHKVPAMRKFSGKLSNIFVTAIGFIAMFAIFYDLLLLL